jgi:hypothetical protein
MKVFNKTDKKWGLFMDNDAAIDPRFHGTDLITTIDANADYIAKRMEIITFVSPRHEPFTEYLETSAERLKTHLPLQKANFLKTTAFLMKNRSAFGQEPVYFDDELDNMEDYEYIGRILAAGGAMYKARSAIMADLGISETVSTLFTAGQEESRLSTYPVKRKILFDRYQPHGLTQSANGNFNWSEIGNNKTLPKYFYVPVNGVGEPIEENTFGALFEA